MALKNVLLEVHRNTPSYTVGTDGKRTRGTYKNQVYTVTIQILDVVQSFFNIPAVDPGSQADIDFSHGSSYKRWYYNGAGDTTGKQIDVETGPRSKQMKGNRRVKTARLKMEGRFVGGGSSGKKLRTCGIAFPPTFSAFMIQQALGTMIKAKNPGVFTIDGGGRYALIPCKSELMTNAKEGAWVATGTVTRIDPNDVAYEDAVMIAADQILNS